MSFYVLDGVSNIDEQNVLLWNILAFVDTNSEVELQWDIYNYTEEDLELQWDIPEIPTFSDSVELQWHILKFTNEADLELLWDLLNYDIPEYQFNTEKRTRTFI